MYIFKMYKLKQKEFYKKTYNLKLAKGQLFKANNDHKALQERISQYDLMDAEGVEKDDEIIEKENRIRNRINLKVQEIHNLKNDVVKYTSELEQHNSGSLDEEYEDRYEQKETEKELRREKKNEKKVRINTENRKASKQFYSNSRQASSRDRYNKKQYDYHYRYFVRQHSKIPPYILSNLDRMPNNKGYIWRKIWYYGRLPIPKIKNKNGEFVDDMSLKMHELVGKDVYIRYRDQNGKWTITKKEKSNYKNNNYKNNRHNNNYKSKHKHKSRN